MESIVRDAMKSLRTANARLRRLERQLSSRIKGQYIPKYSLELPELKRAYDNIDDLDPQFDTEHLAVSYIERERLRREIAEKEAADSDRDFVSELARTQDARRSIIQVMTRMHYSYVEVPHSVFTEYIAPLISDFQQEFGLIGKTTVVLKYHVSAELKSKLLDFADVLGIRVADNGSSSNVVHVLRSKSTCWFCTHPIEKHAVKTMDGNVAHLPCMWIHKHNEHYA